MKKNYMKPETLTVVMAHEYLLATDSADSSRNVDGGVTDNPGGMPGTVGETDGEVDPYGDHGQGVGGAGNRSKWGNLWNDFEDEEDW